MLLVHCHIVDQNMYFTGKRDSNAQVKDAASFIIGRIGYVFAASKSMKSIECLKVFFKTLQAQFVILDTIN